MFFLARISGKYNKSMEKAILGIGGQVEFVSSITSLIIVSVKNSYKLIELPFIKSVFEDIEGSLKAVEVRPSIRFSKLKPFSNYVNTKVAVVDSGIDTNILKVNVSNSINYTQSDKVSYLHGTGVTDIINQIVPGVNFISAKVTNDGRVFLTDVIKALEWAYINKADVINLSLGFPTKRCKGNCPLCELVEEITKKGVLVVVAAGNEGPALGTINCPGNCTSAFTVGAINLNKEIAQESSRGRYGQLKPDIVTSGYIYITDKKEIEFGTSFATPIITGISAAIFSKYKKPMLVKDIIMNSTDNLGYQYNDQGKGLLNIIKLTEVLEVG